MKSVRSGIQNHLRMKVIIPKYWSFSLWRRNSRFLLKCILTYTAQNVHLIQFKSHGWYKTRVYLLLATTAAYCAQSILRASCGRYWLHRSLWLPCKLSLELMRCIEMRIGPPLTPFTRSPQNSGHYCQQSNGAQTCYYNSLIPILMKIELMHQRILRYKPASYTVPIFSA